MNPNDFKLIVLNRIAIELYNGIKDRELIGEERLNEINRKINASFSKGRKLHNAVMRNPRDKNIFDYAKHVIYRLVLLNKYLELPHDDVIEKFVLASRKDEKQVYDYLVYSLEKYGEIKNLTPDDDLDIYSVLLHVLDALNIKTEKPLIEVKSMKFIRKHNIHDLANVCGIFESYKQNRIGTMRKINEILCN